MKTYQIKHENDNYKSMYEECKRAKDIEYIGSVSQPELSKILKSKNDICFIILAKKWSNEKNTMICYFTMSTLLRRRHKELLIFM